MTKSQAFALARQPKPVKYSSKWTQARVLLALAYEDLYGELLSHSLERIRAGLDWREYAAKHLHLTGQRAIEATQILEVWCN